MHERIWCRNQEDLSKYNCRQDLLHFPKLLCLKTLFICTRKMIIKLRELLPCSLNLTKTNHTASTGNTLPKAQLESHSNTVFHLFFGPDF